MMSQPTNSTMTMDQLLLANDNSSLTATTTVVYPVFSYNRGLPILQYSVTMTALLSFAYIIVFVLAIFNNSLVVSVIARNPNMRNVTNYFLANLAVADIMVSFFVLPITLLSNIFSEWWFGPILCKAVPYLQAVVVSASVNTLAAVALERFFAIFYPQYTIITPKSAVVIIAVMWLFPMGIQVPWALYQVRIFFKNEHMPLSMAPVIICYPQFGNPAFERGFFLGVVFVTCYVVPLFFISICYAMIAIKVWKRSVGGIRGSQAERNIQRSKIRIVRMLIVVAVLFALSWLPLYSIRLKLLYAPPDTKQEKSILKILKPIAQWLGSANSCVNPFVYCYFSEPFRRSIIAVLKSGSIRSRIKI